MTRTGTELTTLMSLAPCSDQLAWQPAPRELLSQWVKGEHQMFLLLIAVDIVSHKML